MRAGLLAILLAVLAPPGTSTAETVTWPLPEAADYDTAYTDLAKRHGFKLPLNYTTEIRAKSQPGDPTYELHLPPDHNPEEKYGLFVWISAGDSGKPPREDWLKVLARRKLIWIGPNNVGNETDTLWRTYMATEAVRQAKARFDNIDPNRVYVAGVSGGGRIASHAALVAPDLFTGGFYVVGCDFWRDVPVTPGDRHGKHYRGFWRKPDGNLLRKARQNRYVLLTGEHDFNRANTKAVYDGYRKDNYAHVTLFDIPGMGHTVPNAEWFEKAIAFLDEPKPDKPATRPTTRPKPTGKIILGPRSS
jgi:poly(3-hydroxybutyrate) depolymerase